MEKKVFLLGRLNNIKYIGSNHLAELNDGPTKTPRCGVDQNGITPANVKNLEC